MKILFIRKTSFLIGYVMLFFSFTLNIALASTKLNFTTLSEQSQLGFRGVYLGTDIREFTAHKVIQDEIMPGIKKPDRFELKTSDKIFISHLAHDFKQYRRPKLKTDSDIAPIFDSNTWANNIIPCYLIELGINGGKPIFDSLAASKSELTLPTGNLLCYDKGNSFEFTYIFVENRLSAMIYHSSPKEYDATELQKKLDKFITKYKTAGFNEVDKKKALLFPSFLNSEELTKQRLSIIAYNSINRMSPYVDKKGDHERRLDLIDRYGKTSGALFKGSNIIYYNLIKPGLFDRFDPTLSILITDQRDKVLTKYLQQLLKDYQQQKKIQVLEDVERKRLQKLRSDL